LDLLDKTNIWQQIAYNQFKSGKTTLITSATNIGAKDLAIASINVKGKNDYHQISVIGPNRMDYSKIKGILDFLKENIERKYHEQKN
jgi:heat-inducible transcriptional repressor